MEPPSSPFRVLAVPTTPLQQLSPDRINQQRIHASPSLPNQLSNSDLKLPPQAIDVQSKVAFLNGLNQAGSPSRQQGSSTHSALQRSLLGREEAENALRVSNAQLAEAEVRQRKIGERLEGLMEELQTVKERQVHERQVFEKEVRKARKDAFRAGSALVKLQEDLKEARAEAKTLRGEAQHERFEKEKSKQESFERAYTLAGLLEEVEVMREKTRAMEAARQADILEQQSRTLQREEDDQLMAGKRQQQEEEYEAKLSEARNKREIQEEIETAPIRQNRFERLSVEPLVEATITLTTGLQVVQFEQSDHSFLQDSAEDIRERLLDVDAELQWEKKLRTRAEETIHFLQMECQFNMCACRVAERNGKRFIHDKEYKESAFADPAEGNAVAQEQELQDPHTCDPDEPIQGLHQKEEDLFNISKHERREQMLSKKNERQDLPTRVLPSPTSEVSSSRNAGDISPAPGHTENLSSIKNTSSPAMFSAEDMTYQPPIQTMIRSQSACSTPLRDPLKSPPARSPSASPYPLTPGLKTPQRQGLKIVHAQTTTMMVPLRDNDDVFCPAPGTPGTPVSREAALAQIRARRDRARSVAMSTSKSAPGSARRGLVGGLRDISAPGRF